MRFIPSLFLKTVTGLVLLFGLISFGAVQAQEAAYQAKKLRQLSAEASRLKTDQPQTWYQLRIQNLPDGLKWRATFPDTAWWEQFGDPTLSGYIMQAIAANPDLKVAYLRIEEQRQLVRQARSDLFPSVSLPVSTSASRNLLNSIAGSGGGSFVLQNETQYFTQIPIRVAYEPDIWGKYYKNTQSQKAVLRASEYDYQQVRILLAANVATAYFNLMAADALLVSQAEAVAVSEKDMALETAKWKEGLLSRAAVDIKQAALAQARIRLTDNKQAQALAHHQLAVLLGRTPETVGDLPRAKLETFAISPNVETGYPAGLLRRRPDIMASEQMFLSSKYSVQAARRVLLPALNLAAQLGYSSIKVGDAFSSNGLLALLSGGASQSLFSGFRDWAALKQREIHAEAALENYRCAILNTFREVNDATACLKADSMAFLESESAVTAQAHQLDLLQARYREGDISAQDVLPGRLTFLQTQQEALLHKQALLIDHVSLYKALGGGY